MVLLWNKKMMSPFVEPDNGGSNEPSEPETKPEDEVYENAGIEQETINSLTSHVSMSDNSLTLNLTNFLNDYDMVTLEALYRTSEKESKGAENLANGKPRYYPATYVEAMKETAAEEESDEPDEPVDPPADPQVNE